MIPISGSHGIFKHVLFGIIFTAIASVSIGQTTGPNILFIAVDDLRPELNCYGAHHVKTPNIDRLAASGVLFERAYCQQAVCAPSRNSILTGLRPDALGIYDLGTHFRDKVPDVVTLPQLFKANGYRAEAVGKIYHQGHGNKNDVQSWSVPHVSTGQLMRDLKPITSGDTTGLQSDFPQIDGLKLPFYSSSQPEENMTDAKVADWAVDRLKTLKDSTFFLAVGFIKPHLPFVAPKKYWDLYDPDKIKIPARKNPDGMPDFSLANFGELRKYHNIPADGYLDDEISRNLIHGYYAAVSMIDAQIGKLLDALDQNGLTENTIVVLWGDHGFKIGEYGNWCKHSNIELDTNVPLLISSPGIMKGVKTTSLAELVDIYPTLCDLAGIDKPEHLEGQSLLPVLKDKDAIVNKVAISQYPRGKKLGYDQKQELMGYAICTDRYRYIRWQKYEDPTEVIARELYDLKKGRVSSQNLAVLPQYKKELSQLDQLMNEELGKYRLLKPSKTVTE